MLLQILQLFRLHIDKIDRIEHKEIEKFKTHVLNTDFHGMTIKQWSNIFSSKDEAKLEYALKTLL